MKGIKKGLAILLVLCTLLSMVAMTGAAAPQSDDVGDAQTMAAESNFMKMVLIDSGRGFVSVDNVKAIIDEMARCDYEYLMLGIGNDGLRFLLEDMSVTANDQTYNGDTIKNAIIAKNDELAPYAKGQWSEDDMDAIIAHATSKGISIVPLLNTPGHAASIVEAMTACGIQDCSLASSGTDTENITINIENEAAAAFAEALVKKYIQYFSVQGCTYFNLGCDEYGGNTSNTQDETNQAIATYVTKLCSAMTSMTPMAFTDVLSSCANVPGSLIGINWKGTSLAGHSNINANYNWYYVLGATGTGWAGYDRALNAAKNTPVTQTLGGTAGAGSLLAIWNDNYLAFDGYLDNVKTLIRTLAVNNPDYFTTPEERTITVTAGETVTDTIAGGDYAGTYLTDNPSIATVSAAYGQVSGGTTYTRGNAVTSITSGQKYIIVNTRSGLTLQSETNGDGLLLSNATTVWEITKSGNNYYNVVNNGKYLAVGNASASVGNSNTLYLLYSNSGGFWDIISSSKTYYLNQYGGTASTMAAGYTSSGSSDVGSRWTIYEAVEQTEQPVSATTVTFTGVAPGTTYVTVGNVHYTINVIAENLSKVTPLTVHMYISTNPVWDRNTGPADNNGTPPSGAATSVSVSAAKAYGADGIELASVVPEVGAWAWASDAAPTVYWKGVVLHGIQQSETQSEDYSMQGTDYYYIRYYGGNWQYSADRTTWHTVDANDEVDAYYLMKTTVSQEVDTYVKDWAFTTSTASGQEAGRYQKALSFAVVYPSGQMSPSESEIYANSTLIYWDNLAQMTFIRVGVNEVYEVEKITYTFGARSNPDGTPNWGTEDSIDWQKVTIEENEWYNETVCWDETYGTEPVVNGAALSNAINVGESPDNYTDYDGNWGANDAVLILIYLKPVVTEDSLTVRYWDDSANSEIYSYHVNITNTAVEEAGTFLNRLRQTSAVNTGEFTLDNNAYVVNAKNQNETFQKDLTKIPSLFGKYTSGLYDYVKAEISADGKTLILHYNLDSSKLSKNYVVDFGLPVEIPFSDLVTNADTIQSVTVATQVNGTATIDDVKKVIRYAPERAYTGVVTLSVTVTFTGGTTEVFSVGITPATTVYYEEGFAVPYNASATGGSKGTEQQATESAGSKVNVYGYDAAYAETVGDSNNSAMKLAAGAGAATFTFTGTGVDIYTRSTTETGSLMIRVVDSNGALVKVLSVNTIMKNGSTGATDDQEVTAYNVPIVSLSGLKHGTYTLQIAAVKSGSAGAKDVYIDGFRVHGTLENQANDVYTADQEYSPVFIELRDEVLTAQNVNTDNSQYANQIAENVISQVYAASNSTTGAVIMSNNAQLRNADLQDLLDNGPKNEIYLQPNQALTFNVTTSRVVQIGLKALNQATKYTITGKDPDQTLNASTDMFYTVLNKVNGDATAQTITITNKGEGILSITELKICDDPNATLGELTAEDLIPALVSLGYEVEPVDAEAALNITVQAGDQTVTTQLTATGTAGESHIFTAAEIKAAAEAVLPDDYTLDGVTFEDVTVVCGEQGETSYTAEAVQNPTPDQPTKVLQKLLAVIKNIFERLFRWL
ncbi:MAG: family 20 glycosylhydrolase [Oscillospiraceae bacterium]